MTKHPQIMINIYKEPKLTKPVLIAAWPGIGNVALGAVSYLKEKLQAKEFAEIDPLPFFEPNGVIIEDNLIQHPKFPQNKFYYHKGKGRGKAKGKDLIILLGEAQPTSKTYDFANIILDLAQSFGVRQVYTFAAALIQNFAEKPRVWPAATDMELIRELEGLGLVLKNDFYVAGMNGLLLSIAKERNMKGICLLGETPRYLGEMGNPLASQSILEVLNKILRIEIDMTELEIMGQQAYKEIEKVIHEGRRDFIDRFTVPLWERTEEEDKG